MFKKNTNLFLKNTNLQKIGGRSVQKICQPILESLCEESSANKPKKIVRKRVHKKNMGNGMRKSARLVKGHSEVNVNVVNANWINEEQLILGKNQHVSLCDSSNAAQITSCSDVSLSQKIVNTEGLPKKHLQR